MTTWHADDSLEEALLNFADVAWLPQRREPSDWLTVVVGCLEWTHRTHQCRTDLASLRAFVLPA